MRAIADLKNKNYPQLIPGFKKPERKLLSVVMSLFEAVPSFRGVLLKNIGYNTAEKSTYDSYMEPQFESSKAPNGSRPDGFFVCTRGKSAWSALIEAKAGKNPVDSEQIQKYIDLAAFYKIDSVISISNEFALTPYELPYTLNKSKRKARNVVHLSWAFIKSEIAMFLENETKCSDAEQRILREVHRFLSSPDSGVQMFDQMPEAWRDFVKSSQAPLGFNTKTAGVNSLTHAWQQERRDLCIKLSAIVGYNVKVHFPLKLRKDEKARFREDLLRLANAYELEAEYSFNIPKVSFTVNVEMRNSTCNYIYRFPGPPNKKAKATVTWLTGMLENYEGNDLQVNIDWKGRANDYSASITDFLSEPMAAAIGQNEAPREIVLLIRQQQRLSTFVSRKKFIETLEKTTLNFTEFMRESGLFKERL